MFRPQLSSAGLLLALLCSVPLWVGCGGQHDERLDPQVVGMTKGIAPIYSDGELTLYEVKHSLQLPLIGPSDGQLHALYAQPTPPFDHAPFITDQDLKVQVSFTLSNLDGDPKHPGQNDHTVDVLIDPWNEFGRYWPGMQIVDANEGKVLPNLSGINERYLLPGSENGAASRISGTFTFDDMDELAIDFATVMNIIKTFQNVPVMDGETDPKVTYANHAFSRANRSYNSPLVAPYRPAIIPGLVGFDFGLRTEAPANIALEVVVELVDVNGDRLISQVAGPALRKPDQQITVGAAL